MKYVVQMGSVAMIYIPSFRHSKVDCGGGGEFTNRKESI
jgi:hypothetical protein